MKIAYKKMLLINEQDKIIIYDVNTMAQTTIKTENTSQYYMDYSWSSNGQYIRLIQRGRYPDDNCILKEYEFDDNNNPLLIYSIGFKFNNNIDYVSLSPDKKYIAYLERGFVCL